MKLLQILAAGVIGGGGLPAISVSPSSLDFGSISVGSPATLEVEITNTGTVALVITLPITMAGAEASAFTVTVQPAVTSLAPGASTTFTVQATAASVATFNANISITNNSAENPKLVAVAANVTVLSLLRDGFTTPDAAPLASPRACEPGAGTLNVVDTTNRLSIASDALQVGAGTTAFTVVSNTIARAAGVAMSMEIQRPPAGNNAPVRFGMTNGSGDDRWGSFLISNSISNDGIFVAGGSLIQPIIDYPTIERYMVIERAAGAFLIISVGGHNYLAWIDAQANQATPQAAFVSANAFLAASPHSADNLRVDQLGAPYNVSLGLAIASDTTPTAGDSLVAEADGTVEMTWTPVAAEIMTIEFRRTDANNLMKLVCDQAAGTLKLYSRVAGLDTELNAGKTQTWTVGTPRRIVVSYHDDIIRTVVANTIKHNTINTPNIAGTGVRVDGFATATNLICWPWEIDLPAPFNSFNHVAYVSYGDSKTASGLWQPILTSAISIASNQTWFNTTVAHSNQTVSTMHDTFLTNDMAALKVDPAHILCNLGANDAQIALPTEATWKAKYLAIFDAMHAKCPDALIYVAKAWVRNQATRCNTLATWTDDIIALRSFLRAGHDERVWMENDDNGVTYTSDGIHYNAAGDIAVAAQWQTILGY